jgi:parallel beta-helix repeat protein
MPSPTAAQPPTGATVVGTEGPECPSPVGPSIQAAINAAGAGDTIYVCPGSYPENVSIDKDITLLGPQFRVPATATNRTAASAEATIAPASGNGITYGGAGTSGTVSGFTITGSGTGIFAINGGSGYAWTNNVITASTAGMNMRADDTKITGNRISGAANNNGQGGVFLTQGPSNDLTVANNAFMGNGTDVNTTGSGGTAKSSGLVITNNTSTGSGNLVSLFLTDGAKISDNTITNSTGTAFFVDGGNVGTTISGNTISGGNATGIRIGNSFYQSEANSKITVRGNTVTTRSNGIQVIVSAGDLPSSTISNNVVRNSTNNGIWLAGGAGITVSGNRALDSGATDCVDETTGSGTAGTANSWTGDTGRTSDPAGLCTAIKPTITSGKPPNGTVGKTYHFTVTATGSPEISYAVSAGSLPPGLTLDPATIAGTPTAAGTYAFTITATNEFGSDSARYTVVITAAPTSTSAPTTAPPASSGPATGGGTGGSGNLANTGAPTGALLATAVLLIGAGVGLLLVTRRRRRAH